MSGLIRDAGQTYLALTNHQVAGEEELKKAKKRAKKQRELRGNWSALFVLLEGLRDTYSFSVTGGQETEWASGT